MISLVIISLVVAAFTPVITKKMQSKKAASSIENPDDMDDETIAELKAKTADMFLPFDAVAGKTQTNADGSYFKCNSIATNSTTKARTITCKVKIPSDHVSIVMVGAGGGGTGACSSNAEKGSTTLAPRSYNYHRLTEMSLTHDMSKVVITKIGDSCRSRQGTRLHKLEHETEIEYIKECPIGSSELIVGSGDKYCITKYNVRPANYADYHYNYPSTKTKIAETAAMSKEIKVDFPENTLLTDSGTNAEYSYILANKNPVCWVGPITNCSGNSDDYPNCGRTVCNWYAANIMCPEVTLGENNCSDDGVNFDKPCKGRWRLISEEEFKTINPNKNIGNTLGNSVFLYSIIGQLKYPLYYENSIANKSLCTTQCKAYSNCEGSTDSTCNPSDIWGASTSEKNAIYSSLQYGAHSYNSTKESARSVRCIMQKSKGHPLHTYVKESTGGTSAVMTNLTIPQNLIKECLKNNDCKLSLLDWDEFVGFDFASENAYILRGDYKSDYPDKPLDDRIIYLVNNITKEKIWGYKVQSGKTGGSPSIVTANENEEIIVGKGGLGGRLCYEYTAGNGWSEGFDCKEESRGTGTYGIDGNDGEIIKYREKIAGDIYMPIGECWIWNASGKDYTTSTDIYNANSLYCSSPVSISTIKIKFDGAGAGGGGGAFAHIKDIPITPNKEYTIVIGGGGTADTGTGSGYICSIRGSDGGDTVAYFDNNTVLTAQGGKISVSAPTRGAGSKDGKHSPGGIGGIFEAVSDSDVINAILNDDKKTIKASGGNGSTGKFLENLSSAGGYGGASGITITTGIIKNSFLCGGLLNNTDINCANENDRNGSSPTSISKLHAPVKHIFLDGNYGSYGAGGGGGASEYDDTTLRHLPGNGSAGQDGYVYFYWNKQ